MDETRRRLISFRDLPSHLILEMLTSGHFSVIDLVNIELTSKVFGFGLTSSEFMSLADHAAFLLCSMYPIFVNLSLNHQKELFERCKRNWKRVLRFLQCIVASSDMAETSRGKMQITAGHNYTMVIKNSKVYSCGSNRAGALSQGKYVIRSLELTPIDLPVSAQVIQVSATRYKVAFILESGEVFTCGRNYPHTTEDFRIYTPELVEALNGTPCKQVAVGLYSTVFLTREGHVFTVGEHMHGLLGHGDTMTRSQVPKMVQGLEKVVQISAGPEYVLAVTEEGSVYSFGRGNDLCLGHGDDQDKYHPQAIQEFKTKGVHILRVSAGDAHAIALDSNGYVYTWGRGFTGLGHGERKNSPTPKIMFSLKNHIAVQVCAEELRSFVVVESGLVYASGLLQDSSLKLNFVDPPRVLETLRPHRVLQISAGKFHTMVVTQEGRLFGFGNNRESQLGHHSIQSWLEPTEISLNC